MCLKKVCLIILSFPVFVFAKTDINFSCKKDKESFEVLNLENKLQGVYISKDFMTVLEELFVAINFNSLYSTI